jgi:hypothetical protein
MAEISDASPHLAPEDAARLTDFARACKAAARAVVLYPGSHPAIATTLGRIAQITSPPLLSQPLTLSVRPDALLLAGRSPARPDAAIAELATLLHDHMVGELTIHPGGDVEAWRSFLLLLGRAPDAVRAEGGLARLWATMAGRHVEVREIDYANVLREREEGLAAAWDQIITNCLQGSAFEMDEETARAIAQMAADAERLAELLKTLDARAAAGGAGTTARTDAVLRLLRGVVDAVTKTTPERLDTALRNMAGAIGQLSPDMMVDLLARGATAPSDADDTPELITAVVSRMSDRNIATFVARSVQADGTATDRLAQAFQTLVREGEERQRLLSMAQDDVAASPFGQTDGFQDVWGEVARKLLTSYSDKTYVSDDYGRSLSSARAHAIQVEQVSDDPPERMTRWLRTVATTALRSLDLQLLLDLLRIEDDIERWSGLMRPVVAMIDDLLLVGDFDAAAQLIGVLVNEASPQGQPQRRQTAIIAIDTLVEGQMMRHITTHLATIDEVQFERIKAMAVSMGEVLVRPLAEALSNEERARTRERLTAMLVAFGPSGRRVVERLKSSANPAVRRTAIYLLREFGGTEALPDLTELLNDREPQVQREAVRAILTIGTDSAYQILEKALSNGSETSRDAIMHSIGLVRDERATPLFAYILKHVDHRGALSSVYLRAIESLGALRDPEAVAPLKDALYRGEWWAPRRTAALRGAAAAALARIGTPAARAVLEEAASARARGVRHAARTQSIKLPPARVEAAK